MKRILMLLVILGMLLAPTPCAWAQETQPANEIVAGDEGWPLLAYGNRGLGRVGAFAADLCGEPGSRWRDEMEQILAAENPEPERRARLVASFNHGYSAYARNHAVCTDSAVAAIGKIINGPMRSHNSSIKLRSCFDRASA